MKSVFAKYLPSFDFNERIRGSELEYGVALWLQNLAWGDEFAKEATQDISAEFLAAVQGGAVSFGETV
jgi:hypothetical protein